MLKLEQNNFETMKFLRGKYKLNEIGNGKDELKFKQGQKTILTIYIHDDKYTFLIIFGKKEREQFENVRETYSQYILKYYDNSKTFHDGKWMFIDVNTLEHLNEVKRLIMIKKKPNRKPYSKEGALYGDCGQRCDLCVHYTGLQEEMRNKASLSLTNVWKSSDWSIRCGGCNSDTCYCKGSSCDPQKCAAEKNVVCNKCNEFPCFKVGFSNPIMKIHTNIISADDVTLAILPFVPMQYEE